MSWVLGILDLLVSFFAKIFIEANKTPAIQEEVKLEEGNLVDPHPSEYDGMYGVCSGDQGEADSCVCESPPDS